MHRLGMALSTFVMGSAGAALLAIAGALLIRGDRPVTGAVSAVTGAALITGAFAIGRRRRARPARASSAEPSSIHTLEPAMQRELIRGTSMHLRDMRYPYSVRYDRSERRPFTKTLHGVTLAFIPVILTENATERQGYGWVAFPHDGERFRGPGLPCTGSPEEAAEQAARVLLEPGEDAA